MHANKPIAREYLKAGEIGAVIGFDKTLTGNTICDEDHPIVLEAIEFPAPVISVSIQPETRGDRDKLSLGLAKLAEEDPTFVVSFDHETEETIMSGMGELHLEILVDRLKREHGVAAKVGRPQVAYRETATMGAEVDQKLQRQTGGKGDFARVCLTCEPLPPGTGFEFVNDVKGGNVPKEYIPAVEKGIVEAMSKGVYAGFPIVDLRVSLVDGDYHDVDSSERAFNTCASMAFKDPSEGGTGAAGARDDGQRGSRPDHLGPVNGDLGAPRPDRGHGAQGREQEIRAFVPLGMFGYATSSARCRAAPPVQHDVDHHEKCLQPGGIVAWRAKTGSHVLGDARPLRAGAVQPGGRDRGVAGQDDGGRRL
jgi:elongation factor G